jgi:hypothetical protein
MHDSADRTPHADHDLLVIAAGTDSDADPAARAAAARQSATCPECDELARDLRAIAAGLQSLPRSIPAPAARDFRISPDQAKRLERGNGLRRLLRPFGPGGMPSLRPLSAAFTTLGVAGLLFTLVLPGMMSFGAAGSAPARVSGQAVPGDSAALDPQTKYNATPYNATPPTDLTGAVRSPAVAASPGVVASQAAVDFGAGTPMQPAPQPESQDSAATTTPTASTSPWSPTALLSVFLLAAGVLLFALRLAAYRLR